MSISKIIGLSVIGLVAWYFLRLKKTISDLNYRVTGVSLSFDGITPILKMDLALQNVYNTSFTIRSIVGNLYANGFLIANVQNVTPAVVPANASATYSIYARLSLVGAAADVVNIFSGGGVKQELEFSGNAAIDNLVSPIDFKYMIG